MQRRKGIVIAPLLIAGLVMLFQYMSSEKVVNPETGRAARVAMSVEQEQALGFQSYREVLSQSQVVTSGPEHELVMKVAARLAPATGEAARNFDWEVSVVQSSQANAFCLPGGKIVVYTGILPVAKTEAGLATVIGHEVAHAVARHGAQRVFQNSLVQTALIGASFSLSDMDFRQRQTIMGLLGAGATYGVMLPFGRDHEVEADQMGLLYMARAGYDPREAIPFWERMGQAAGNGQPPEFMSTHPSHGTRIQNLQAFMSRAIEEYEKSKGQQTAVGDFR